MNEEYGFDAGVLERIKTEFDTVATNLTAVVTDILDVKERTSGVWESNSINTYHLEMSNFAEDANSLSNCVQQFRGWVELAEQLYSNVDANNDEMWVGFGQ